MRTRLAPAVLAVAVVAVVAPLPAAEAARARRRPQPPSCRLVVDPANDGNGFAAGQKFPTYDTGVDLVGADLASTSVAATAVFRFLKANETDWLSSTGRYFELAYTPKGKPEARIWVVVSGVANYSDGTVTVDTENHEIRVTVPLAKAGLAGLKAATPVTKLKAFSQRWAGAYPAAVSQPIGDHADDASSNATYPLHNKSCVAVGK